MTKVKTRQLLNGLEEELQKFSSNPDDMYKHWQICRKQFHNYSLRNIMIANWQLYGRKKRTVEKLASYKNWQKMGRQVQYGEKGLKILAPLIKKNDEEEDCYGFRQVTVFDISQTEGKDLFYDDNDIVSKTDLTLSNICKRIEKETSLSVIFDMDSEITKGETDFTKIRCVKNVSDEEKMCIIWHELAHNLLCHNERKLSDSLMEMEAESVSFIVAKYFDIENKSSIRYIHNWNLEKINKFSLENANQIVKVSDRIIEMMIDEKVQK